MNPKLWGMTSRGHNPWSIVSWGKRAVGPEVASPEVVGRNVTGAISLEKEVVGHNVSRARRCGARCLLCSDDNDHLFQQVFRNNLTFSHFLEKLLQMTEKSTLTILKLLVSYPVYTCTQTLLVLQFLQGVGNLVSSWWLISAGSLEVAKAGLSWHSIYFKKVCT